MKKVISPFAPKKIKKFEIINGVSVSSIHCGIKKNLKDDLVLIKFDNSCDVLGFFTSSTTPGEPIKWNKKIISHQKVSAILINSGNANVNTGTAGELALKKIVNFLSKSLKVNKKEIYIASTGVIGEKLDEKKIINAIPKLINLLNNESTSWVKAANAIRTTDTYPKIYSKKFKLGKKDIVINGLAKGSGMIEPNMATMLAFVFTNYDPLSKLEKKAIEPLIEKSFNSITVDGDMSTSDMVLVVSGIRQKVSKQNLTESKYKSKFSEFLFEVMIELSKLIVKDGEGISKFITVNVKNADNYNNAKKISKSISNSLLFKTAMAGNDFNWGRIIMAIGKVPFKLKQENLSIKFGNFKIVNKGKIINYDENKVTKYIKKGKVKLEIDLGIGSANSEVWTCDLTKDYISINADYRS